MIRGLGDVGSLRERRLGATYGVLNDDEILAHGSSNRVATGTESMTIPVESARDALAHGALGSREQFAPLVVGSLSFGRWEGDGPPEP